MFCLNKRVIIGVALVALAIFAFSPQLLGTLAPLLVIAVCPLSMLVMMRMNRRSGQGDGSPGDVLGCVGVDVPAR